MMRSTFRCLTLLAGSLAASIDLAAADNAGAPPSRLTIDRLFAAPDLGGPSLRGARFSPDGKTLGDVKQANDVPRGALDQGWGPAALAVAEAAATGIFDIVKRYQ